MIILFVHGWSVRHTDTYGDLPRWLATQKDARGRQFQVENVFLGKYISFDDAVTIDDLARAMQHALETELGPKLRAGNRFAAITHSTGGPVVRAWMDIFWKNRLSHCPLSHLVMLAPANHGSALAQLGKSRLSRIQSFFHGVEPGQGVLDWLELGSAGAWALNQSWLSYDCVAAGVFPFVLTGQSIDRKLYDALNSYTGEAGSDGVVRVASANMNYCLLRLVQKDGRLEMRNVQRTEPTALGVLPGMAHSGKHKGILRSITMTGAAEHPTAQWVLRCLRVQDAVNYRQLSTDLETLTDLTQKAEREEWVPTLLGTRTFTNPRHTMIIFRMIDDRGNRITDYDLYFTAGPNYDENQLPVGFFRDRQRNQLDRGKLTYFLNHDAMLEGLLDPRLEGRLGFHVVARPVETVKKPKLICYRPLEFRGTLPQVSKLLLPNETLMVEIQLERRVDAAVFQIEKSLVPSPISSKPTGTHVPESHHA